MKTKITYFQLATYSGMIAGTLAATNADAQIIYTELDPDIILLNLYDDNYDLDFNVDGVIDMDIEVNGWGDMYCGSSTYGPDCVGYSSGSVFAHANGFLNNAFETYLYGIDTLNVGDPISIDGNFNPGFTRLFQGDGYWYDDPYLYFYNGNWFDLSNKYAGVRFLIDGAVHFGWVELSVTPTFYPALQNVTIHSYAYEATPGMPIHAGDIGGCFPPEPIGAIVFSPTSAKTKWETVGSADYYELQYHTVGAAAWTTKIINAPKTFRKINSLTCDTDYEWQVRAVCADGTVTGYSPLQFFTTASCRLENENAIDEENIDIYSSSNQLYVNIDEDLIEPANLIVYDQLGRTVLEHEITQQINVFELNVASGLYIVALQYNGNNISKQFILFN